jgi:hypothetical protein
MKRFSTGFMLVLLILIVLFGFSTQYRDGFQDDGNDQGNDQSDQSNDQGNDQIDQGSDDTDDDQSNDGMSSRSMYQLRKKLPPMVSRCVKDGLRDFDDA